MSIAVQHYASGISFVSEYAIVNGYAMAAE